MASHGTSNLGSIPMADNAFFSRNIRNVKKKLVGKFLIHASQFINTKVECYPESGFNHRREPGFIS